MIKTAFTTSGVMRGLPAADPRIIAYKGIPFAAPPVGNLRWRAPQPYEASELIRDCYAFAPISMQSIPGLNKENIYTREWNVDPEIPMDEDCLYLNVWTPAETKEDKLPVFVWFFGGALQWGNCAEMEFDGERIARRGIVVVTVNYRLNVFGFLTHPDMKEEAPEDYCNIGHLDQQFGLKWVKENIAAFGGNPDEITIGGQSAGGASVMAQLNHPKNKKYVKRAIVSSGVFSPKHEIPFRITMEESEKQSIEFFHFLGVNTLEEARRLPAEYIRDKNNEFHKFWGTVTDDSFQTDEVWNNLQKGKLLDVPMLIGYTKDEFIFDGVNSMQQGAQMIAEAREKNAYESPLYMYEFGADIPGEDHPGAFHSVDLWFFFETLAKCWRPFQGKDYDLARQMCNYWCEFIKSGNPNGKDNDGTDMEVWNAYTEKSHNIMCFYDTPTEKQK